MSIRPLAALLTVAAALVLPQASALALLYYRDGALRLSSDWD